MPLRLTPSDADLHRELAYLLLSMSEKGQASPEDARKEFEKLHELHPEDYVAAAQLGLIYHQNKDPRATPLFRS
jgi:Flp pilus assembly protein TadD